MGDLENTFRALVDDPPVAPAPLEQLERRATSIRRRRYATNGLMAIAAIAVIGVGGSLLLPDPGAVVGVPPDGSTPTPSESVTVTPTPTPSPTEEATAEPTAGTAAPTTDPTTEPTAPVASAPPPATQPPLSVGLWFNDAAQDQWRTDNGDGYWLTAFFLGENDDPYAPNAQARRLWWLEGDEAGDGSREEFLREALRIQATTPPDGYASGLEGETMELLTALEGQVLDLDFSAASFSRGNYGSASGGAAVLQLRGLLRHYYPEATEACIRIAGQPTDADGPYIFHDTIGCPFQIR